MSVATLESALVLPEKLVQTVNFSMMSGMPILVSYWNEKAEPSTAWRGSTHVHADGRIAIWIRSRIGGLVTAIETNPRVRLAYRNPHTKSFVTFEGVARLASSDAENAAVYESSPPMEQASDPQRLGIGVLVALTQVVGTLEGESVLLEASINS